jgi:hypothetical protein
MEQGITCLRKVLIDDLPHIENERLVETIIIDKDDPRYAELLEGVDADVDFVQAKHGDWRVGRSVPRREAARLQEQGLRALSALRKAYDLTNGTQIETTHGSRSRTACSLRD